MRKWMINDSPESSAMTRYLPRRPTATTSRADRRTARDAASGSARVRGQRMRAVAETPADQLLAQVGGDCLDFRELRH